MLTCYVCSTKIGEISYISKCFENFVSQTLGVLTRIYAAELRDIIISLPNNVAIAVVRFHRTTHIVADDRVAFTVLYLCHRNIRAFLIHPCNNVLYWFFTLHTDATELVNAMLRSVLLLIILLHYLSSFDFNKLTS